MNLPENILQAPLLLGIFYLIAGLIMYLKPAKKPNGWYGYRTPSAMASQERWDFSQRYSATEMLKAGIFAILVSLIGFFVQFSEEWIMGITVIVFLVLIIYPILRTEIALRKKFANLK